MGFISIIPIGVIPRVLLVKRAKELREDVRFSHLQAYATFPSDGWDTASKSKLRDIIVRLESARSERDERIKKVQAMTHRLTGRLIETSDLEKLTNHDLDQSLAELSQRRMILNNIQRICRGLEIPCPKDFRMLSAQRLDQIEKGLLEIIHVAAKDSDPLMALKELAAKRMVLILGAEHPAAQKAVKEFETALSQVEGDQKKVLIQFILFLQLISEYQKSPDSGLQETLSKQSQRITEGLSCFDVGGGRINQFILKRLSPYFGRGNVQVISDIFPLIAALEGDDRPGISDTATRYKTYVEDVRSRSNERFGKWYKKGFIVHPGDRSSLFRTQVDNGWVVVYERVLPGKRLMRAEIFFDPDKMGLKKPEQVYDFFVYLVNDCIVKKISPETFLNCASLGSESEVRENFLPQAKICAKWMADIENALSTSLYDPERARAAAQSLGIHLFEDDGHLVETLHDHRNFPADRAG